MDTRKTLTKEQRMKVYRHVRRQTIKAIETGRGMNDGFCIRFNHAIEKLGIDSTNIQVGFAYDNVRRLRKRWPEMAAVKPSHQYTNAYWFSRGLRGQKKRLEILNKIIND